MAILVQPIKVGEVALGAGNGVVECPKHGDLIHLGHPYRTVSKLNSAASLIGAENDDHWDVIPNSDMQPTQGIVEFATPCYVTSLTLEAEFDRDPADQAALDDGSLDEFGLKVELNGVPQPTLTTPILAGGTKVSATYACTPTPCGNVWVCRSSIALGTPRAGGGPGTLLKLRIIDINA